MKAMNTSKTENGDLNYQSTGNNLLNFYSKSGAMVKKDEKFKQQFELAFAEDPMSALKCLFYFRDIRGGQGIRDNVRDCFLYLAEKFPESLIKNIKHIPEYGRWDDVVFIWFYSSNPKIKSECFKIIALQLKKDISTLKKDGDKANISLLAKWLPSPNTSSVKTRQIASSLRKELFPKMDFNNSERFYRKTLSSLRAQIKIVESAMCSKNWDNINFERVPSKAMKNYRKAFSKQCGDRFSKYIEEVSSGKKRINSSTLNPAEIVRTYMKNFSAVDNVLEEQWKALPNYCDGRNGLVVADVSGSMGNIFNAADPICCSIGLAIYFAQRNTGIFKNSYISFSGNPAIHNIVGLNLRQSIDKVINTEWGTSTNLMAVFDRVLDTAVKHEIAQEEMPSAIYIVSDMQFNQACPRFSSLEKIREKYRNAGYEIPALVFWNVKASLGFPALDTDKGVVLCSGYSTSIFSNILDLNKNPHESMMDVLNSDRYKPIAI